MSAIVYEKLKCRFLASGFKDASSDTLKLFFGKGVTGTVILGEQRFNVLDGECVVDLYKIDDGTYRPVLVHGRERSVMDGFEKRGFTVRILPLPDKEIRDFILEYSALQKRLGEVEKDIQRLTSKIENTTVI